LCPHIIIYFIYQRNKKTKVKFNKNAYFSQVDKDISGRSLQYADMEDVWIINKEYQSSGMKNMNKLPSKLVEKIINYSSDKNDMVCDFFMGSLQLLTVH
jgi:site-specific DNA-methyltransferase (adenine-specific)